MEDHANDLYSMDHNSKQKRVGSRGENSVVKANLNIQPEHADGAGMAGNRTVMHGDELVGVRGGELERSNVVTAAISACDKARGLGCAINACEMECAGEAHDGQCFSCDESPKEIGAQDGPAGRAGQFVVCFGGYDRSMDDYNLEYVEKQVMKNDTHELYKHLHLSLVNFVFKIFEWLHYVVIYVINLIQNICDFLVKHYQQYLYVAMALAAATKDCMGHGELMSVNSLWCCWALSLVLVWMLSHLGCGLSSPENRKQKKMVRRQRIQCQL